MTKTRKAMIITFISGIIVGFVLGLAGARGIARKVHSEPERLKTVVMRRLDRKLALSEEQRPQVEKEIQRTLLELGILHNRTRDRFVGILDRAAERLETVLDRKQQAQLDLMIAEARTHAEMKRIPIDLPKGVEKPKMDQ